MQFGHEFSKYLKWNWMSPFFAPPWRMNCLICILVHLMLNPCNNVCWSRNILIILPWYVVPKWQDTKFTVCFSFLCLLGSDYLWHGITVPQQISAEQRHWAKIRLLPFLESIDLLGSGGGGWNFLNMGVMGENRFLVPLSSTDWIQIFHCSATRKCQSLTKSPQGVGEGAPQNLQKIWGWSHSWIGYLPFRLKVAPYNLRGECWA